MRIFSAFFILIFGLTAFGQKTVADLDSKHATALADFLKTHKNYELLSENKYDPEYLKFMRESFGERLTPAYAVGDFNSDGSKDFAVIIIKTNARPVKNGLTDAPHNLDYKIALVVFNGDKKGGFRQALFEEMDAPLACFINLTDERKKRLYFGIAETDNGFTLKPRGSGYTADYGNGS